MKCASNLRQIGQAILIYANEHGGTLPDALTAVVRTTDITPEQFVCPTTKTEPARDAASFTGGPADCDYIYCGDGLTSDAASTPADAVIALDRPAAHDGEAVNVLFGDGHVEWMFIIARRGVPSPDWTSVQDQIARGVRPVRWPPPATR